MSGAGTQWDTSLAARTAVQQRLDSALRPSRGGSAQAIHTTNAETTFESGVGADDTYLPSDGSQINLAAAGAAEEEEEEYYDPHEFSSGEYSKSGLEGSTVASSIAATRPRSAVSDAMLEVKILTGHGIPAASFAAVGADNGAGPEPFVVFTLGGKNYASQRAVGLSPDWGGEVLVLHWDERSPLLVQVMDQNEEETETLSSQWVDLAVLQLEANEAMPLEVGGGAGNGGKGQGTVQLEVILHR